MIFFFGVSRAVRSVAMRAQTPIKELKVFTATFNMAITISYKFIKSETGIALSFFDVLTDDLIEGTLAVLRKGKRNYHLVQVG